MSAQAVEKIADAVLYEGYMLYPYRPSNVKNRQRWTFGGLYPEACAEASGDRTSLQAEVLLQPQAHPDIEIKVRFLHLLAETRDGRTWQLAVQREVILRCSTAGTRREQFRFPASEHLEGGVVRRQEQIEGFVELLGTPVEAGLHKLTLRVVNTTEFHGCMDISRDEASMRALVASHAILHATGGEFVSLTDPPEPLRDIASLCVNQGVWPVLAGDSNSAEWMLVSPIILYDYPQIAPESPGDLFDGTEIDEILTLRILTMTDQEKEEMRQTDPHLRDLLERTESLTPEQVLKLHGALRSPHALTSRMGEL
ncbi:MAG TPA: hypothetical protein VMH05_07620 [Bryobacteraceae bacterium]|nr:hypothetical protein [Bryobacteraceae bacterium]